MSTNTDITSTLEVWMDGECHLCLASKRWCEHRDRNARLRFVDFRTSTAEELPLPRSDHETSLWVRDDDGALLEGFAAWQRIMSEIPGWRWLARMAAIAPLPTIGRPLYRLIAAYRNRLTPGQPGAGISRSSRASKRGHPVHR